MDDPGSDSDYSETSDSVTSTSSSSSSADGTAIELAKITKHKLQLPKGLCENVEIFNEFFSIETWKDLPDNFQAYLKNKFLPTFPENNELEQERTLRMLFGNEIKRFKASPLIDLQKNLEEGSYRPDVLKLRQSIERSRRREQRFQECERLSRLSKSLIISREKLLRAAYDAPPGTVLRVDRIVNAAPKMNQTAAALRARKRFFEEVLHMTNAMGLSDLSDDEATAEEDILNAIKQSSEIQASPSNETKIIGTMSRKTRKGRSPISSINNRMMLNENNLRQILITHKKRKLEEPDRPEYETNDIRLRDVHARTQLTGSYRKSLTGKSSVKKSHSKIKQEVEEAVDISTEPEITSNNLITNQPTTPQQQPQPQPVMKQSHMLILAGQQSSRTENSNSESEDEISVNVDTVAPVCPPNIVPEEVSNKRYNAQIPSSKGIKKLILNVNGTAVPEQVTSVTNHSNTTITEYPSDSVSSAISLSQYHGKVKAATLSDLEGIDMMHLPVDLDESGNIDILGDIKAESSNSAGPELMQETHACFLSLIRDIFCSTPNHRMRLEELKAKICSWLLNPITALNDWYSNADNWLTLIPSAIHFLAGEFLDQPEDFVPYLEFKTQMNIYQWIGAGRDSDQHLMQLCNYWLARRNEMGNKPMQKFELSNRKSAEFDESLLNERPISPPPPRCPTAWAVQPSTNDEVEEFRIQEMQRFENPHRAFTYRMHGYESVVGPVKGIYTQIIALTKARGHNMLTADRPNFVTILTLVRDATARLPNGEGTRADICELLKSSQYINTQAQDSILQTIVSGALDRMHTEHDPCVRYDPKRKIWIYLHRNRTEDEFERLHQQFQGVGKHKKPSNRKVKQKPAKILQPNFLSSDSSTSVPVVAVPPVTNVAMPKLLPALSSIQQGSPLQITNTATSTNPPPLKLSPPKVVVKPELVPLKPPTPTTEKLEAVDIESAFEARAASVMIPKAQQTLQTLPTLLAENKIQKLTTKKPAVQTAPVSTQPPTTAQIKVATATGIQTVHVSAASVPVSADQKQITSIMATSPMGQTILSSQNQLVMSNKKITKPILISQHQTPSLVSQVTPSSQGYIIPINLNNSEQLKAIPAISSTLSATSNISPKLVKTNQPPALTSTVSPKPTLMQQPTRNFVRVASTTAQTGKSLISPHIAATNITLQQQQKLLSNANTSNISLQHQKIPVMAPTATVGIRPQQKAQLINNTATIKTHQSLTPIQQKQIFQNIISQHNNKNNIQRTNALNITQNTVVIPSGQMVTQQAGMQGKQVIISSQGNVQQQLQKIIVSSASGSIQTSTIGGNTGSLTSHSGGLMSPQIIQIHQTGQGTGTKVQTLNTSNLTPQQQQNLLQTIKQQQKIQQSQSSNQQQSLIIKQQPVFHQIQKQVNVSTPTIIPSTVASNTAAKTVTSVLGANIIGTTTAMGGSVLQHQTQNVAKHATLLQQQNIGKQLTMSSQQQTVTRVIKPMTSIIHPQVISSVSGVRTQSGNPVMAKVLTNSSGQIISLESLLQKQGVAAGTALRVAGAKPNQTSLIQLAGTPGSQMTQYAVVSQGRNLISVGTSQRMITTQATNTSTIVTSLGNASAGKINEHKTTTVMNAGTIQPSIQNQTKVLTANQIHPIAAQQLMNAKVLGKAGAGGIRMVNASNLNIAHIRGKPVIIASKPANISGQQSGQNVILQGPVNSTNLVIGGQTLKVQGNVMTPTSVQVLNQSASSQPQTVMLGNQIIKVQQATPTHKSQATTPVTSIINNTMSSINNSASTHLTTIASTNTGTMVVNSNANLNQLGSKTVVLGSTGQTIRVQSPAQVQMQSAAGSTQGQSMLLGTAVKGTTIKTAGTGQQRVVLAVQGGGQILLPPGFQGGAINLKALQGLKVVSIAQQQNKGQSDERPPMFAQIVSAPRPPNPGDSK